jgi:hypothetical protein
MAFIPIANLQRPKKGLETLQKDPSIQIPAYEDGV